MRVLCLGASNTYGFDPRSYFGSRYPVSVRWPGRLAEKTGWQIFNGGENGTEIPNREWELQRMEQLIHSCQPFDLLVVMLGTNDLLQGVSVPGAAARMERFLEGLSVPGEQVVLIVPPPMKTGAWITDDRLIDKSVLLADAYRAVAGKYNVRFVDTKDWDISLTYDGVHFSAEGHIAFADRLYKELVK